MIVMSQLPSKTNIPVAVPQSTKKTFTQSHQTTNTWLRPRPIFSREYIPGRNMKVGCNSFVRCNPLPVPVMGHAKVHNRAFFVPFRTVMPDWDAFYTGTIYNYPSNHHNIPPRVPYFKNSDVVDLFIRENSRFAVPVTVDENYDFLVLNEGVTPNTNVYIRLTADGVHFLSILSSLGYAINWRTGDTFEHSALPLLCYSKVMLDWYYPSAYVGDASYNFIAQIFNNPGYQGNYIDGTILLGIFEVCTHNTYNPDYFVNGWDNPNGPNDLNVERSIAIKDVTNDASISYIVTNDSSQVTAPSVSTAKPSNGTPFVGGNGSIQSAASGVLTQYIDHVLKCLTDYTKRHQLAGVRVIDRYLAELGITLNNEILRRSMYLGSQDFDIDFFEVYSHAATSEAALGAFAGKGNGFSGDKTFDFTDGKEFGIFLIVNSVMPEIGYYQGQSRETMHNFALDFWHPDFDHMAVQPISKREVYVHDKGNAAVAAAGLNTEIFAYAPKYIEYNVPVDRQTGLYLAHGNNGLLPFYSLFRDLSFYSLGTLAQFKHNIGFVEGSDYLNFNRIFGVDTKRDTFEGFNFIHSFDVEYYDSTLPAYDTYEFDDQENKKVTLDINGSKLN